MRVIVADDEPLALRRMQSSLACIPEVELVGCARNGVEALTMIRSLRPDLVILDIEMPGRSGLAEFFDGTAFLNVNRPEDLARAEALIGGRQ